MAEVCATLAFSAIRNNDKVGLICFTDDVEKVVPLRKGDAVVFAVRHRPQRGTKGDYRVTMRHGVSQVRSGRRHTMGVIFHDAA